MGASDPPRAELHRGRRQSPERWAMASTAGPSSAQLGHGQPTPSRELALCSTIQSLWPLPRKGQIPGPGLHCPSETPGTACWPSRVPPGLSPSPSPGWCPVSVTGVGLLLPAPCLPCSLAGAVGQALGAGPCPSVPPGSATPHCSLLPAWGPCSPPPLLLSLSGCSGLFSPGDVDASHWLSHQGLP